MKILDPVLTRLVTANETEVRRASDATGVPVPTIVKIKYGQTPNPRVKTVEKLYSYFYPTAHSNSEKAA